jgi:threonylcarbamoyladenosine tRNA methylthiotransferase MtaB
MQIKKRIAFHTFGCKLNFSETSSIAREFREGSFEIVDFKEEADVYVINTCSVTGTAEKKCKFAIKQAHRRNPEARIAVIGCFSELKPEEIAAFEGVDIILGSNNKFRLPEILLSDDSAGSWQSAVGSRLEFVPSYSSGERTRSFVKVQDGCDYFCSYCTIPFARGNSRSGNISEVLDLVSKVLKEGFKEIILTGVNVGDFGRKNGETFFDLLKALNEINRLQRVRISSIEPNLLTDDIIEFVATSRNLLPHFHIPLQSGSNKILKLMKRKYERSVFESRVTKIKAVMPHACIAADVIVGFPGETEDDFQETFDFIQKLPISYVHVFSYSERPGTKAAEMTNQVDGKSKSSRSQRLHSLSEIKKREFYESCKGLPSKVLFESDNHDGFMHGFTENYIKVSAPYNPQWVNEIVAVETTEHFVYQ